MPSAELLGGHRVLVERPAEGGLVEMHLVDRGVLGGRGIERARHRGVGALRLRQQVRADRRRSQPDSALIWPTLRKLAPITSVAMPNFL